MKKFTIYCGLNDWITKTQIINTETASALVENICCEICGGATISQARGVYTHENGEKVIENTLVIVLFGIDLETARRAAIEIKNALNQESVVLECVEVESSFI